MRTVIEVIVAFFAAGGLLTLGWFLFGRLLAPVGAGTFALVRADGDATALEHEVQGLLWLRSSGLARFTVVIVDDGLNEQGRALAAALAEEESDILLCKWGELERIF